MRPDPSLGDRRRRAQQRQLVEQRGPDTGRQVDHLKVRQFAGGAEELLRRVELDPGVGGEDLTGTDGGPITLYITCDMSLTDGTDVTAP